MLFDKNNFRTSKIKNRIRLVKAYESQKVKIPTYPTELILEITNECNLACIMCPRINMKRALGMMNFDLFKSIIDQVKDYIELVYISGGVGEPMLHPRLPEMLRYCRKSNVRVGVSTNATLPNLNLLLETPPDIILFSLDAATKETHEKIRVGSKFEKTMANVERFLKEKETKKTNLPFVIVQMVYMPENQAEANLFRNKWQRYKSVNGIRMKKFLHLQGANYYPKLTKKTAQSCILPWKELSISWDGKLVICCMDYAYVEEIGNVKNHSILELWNSKIMQRYRQLLSSGNKNQIELCKSCPGISVNALSKAATVIFDELTIRKLLPMAEEFTLKTGIKLADYG